MAPSAEYGIAVVRRICVADKCRWYALTKSRLWVEAPWATPLLAESVGVLTTTQVTRIGGAEVEIDDFAVVVPLREVMRMRLGEAVLARLTRSEARVVARAFLDVTGLRNVEVRV